MGAFHEQYVIDDQSRRRAVLLPIEEWERIVEELEELDDIRAYDAAKAGRQDAIPIEEAVVELDEGADA